MPSNDQRRDTPLEVAPLPQTIIPLATAVRTLAERWTVEGCNAFDAAVTPADVAAAAGTLRCALELSQVLDRFVDGGNHALGVERLGVGR